MFTLQSSTQNKNKYNKVIQWKISNREYWKMKLKMILKLKQNIVATLQFLTKHKNKIK